ncbi:hypothetical protein EPN96_03615 [bacterium]|nr:MAG: hypothetical protein EPN96_03615 [bacterium]
MGRLTRHVILPFIPALALEALWFTPKETFGCAQRGLMALFVVLAAAAGAFWAIFKGMRAKKGGGSDANWWLLTAIILTLPLLLLLGPLG